MGYSIFLRRESPISLEEWKSVVESRSDVRLRAEDLILRNPSTGEAIRYPRRDGDADVLVDGEWQPAFRLWEGEVEFRATSDFMDQHNPFRLIVRDLARQLSAQVVGEEDEEYK